MINVKQKPQNVQALSGGGAGRDVSGEEKMMAEGVMKMMLSMSRTSKS